MSFAGSQVSQFKAPSSILGKRQVINYQGLDIPMNYLYKIRSEDSVVEILTPQDLKIFVQGDKAIQIRFISIVDFDISTVNSDLALSTLIRVIVDKTRNLFDERGQQSQIIGYLQYDKQLQMMKGDCTLFEMDAKYDIKIRFEKLDVVNNTWSTYILPAYSNNKRSYIYIDCEVTYDYNSNL